MLRGQHGALGRKPSFLPDASQVQPQMSLHGRGGGLLVARRARIVLQRSPYRLRGQTLIQIPPQISLIRKAWKAHRGCWFMARKRTARAVPLLIRSQGSCCLPKARSITSSSSAYAGQGGFKISAGSPAPSLQDISCSLGQEVTRVLAAESFDVRSQMSSHDSHDKKVKREQSA
ncbi:hypothetical protein DPX16_3422 [Anabarilius grahami]|uniref:Uncharacterized protein n=1 Tax=Anabarilius grahami TaxID=495550 RepID=A0A3N0Z1F2_ANAGA|nr:hypothetical protein DPX16_3422 [Anabarilius grahami]